MKDTTALPPVTEGMTKCPNCDTNSKAFTSFDGKFVNLWDYEDGDWMCIICIGCDCRAPFAEGPVDAIIRWNTAARAKNLIRIGEDDITSGDGPLLQDGSVAEEG